MLVADIEKAFLQIAIDEADRDYLRLLWIDDIEKQTPEIQEYRFTRVIFGAGPSPFLLNATLRHHLKKYFMLEPDVIHRIQKSLYVDELVTGAGDSTEALKLYETAKQSMDDGGFNLRKWKSNDVCIRARIQEKESEDKQILPKPEIQVETKILGLGWNQDKDTLTVQLIKEKKRRDLRKSNKVS